MLKRIVVGVPMFQVRLAHSMFAAQRVDTVALQKTSAILDWAARATAHSPVLLKPVQMMFGI